MAKRKAKFVLPDWVEHTIHDYLMECEATGIMIQVNFGSVEDWVYSTHPEINIKEFDRVWAPLIRKICREYGIRK